MCILIPFPILFSRFVHRTPALSSVNASFPTVLIFVAFTPPNRPSLPPPFRSAAKPAPPAQTETVSVLDRGPRFVHAPLPQTATPCANVVFVACNFPNIRLRSSDCCAFSLLRSPTHSNPPVRPPSLFYYSVCELSSRPFFNPFATICLMLFAAPRFCGFFQNQRCGPWFIFMSPSPSYPWFDLPRAFLAVFSVVTASRIELGLLYSFSSASVFAPDFSSLKSPYRSSRNPVNPPHLPSPYKLSSWCRFRCRFLSEDPTSPYPPYPSTFPPVAAFSWFPSSPSFAMPFPLPPVRDREIFSLPLVQLDFALDPPLHFPTFRRKH